MGASEAFIQLEQTWVVRGCGGKEEEGPGLGREQSQAFAGEGGNYILETSGGEAGVLLEGRLAYADRGSFRHFQGCSVVAPVRLGEDTRRPSYPRVRCFKGFGGERELIAAKQVKD